MTHSLSVCFFVSLSLCKFPKIYIRPRTFPLSLFGPSSGKMVLVPKVHGVYLSDTGAHLWVAEVYQRIPDGNPRVPGKSEP